MMSSCSEEEGNHGLLALAQDSILLNNGSNEEYLQIKQQSETRVNCENKNCKRKQDELEREERFCSTAKKKHKKSKKEKKKKHKKEHKKHEKLNQSGSAEVSVEEDSNIANTPSELQQLIHAVRAKQSLKLQSIKRNMLDSIGKPSDKIVIELRAGNVISFWDPSKIHGKLRIEATITHIYNCEEIKQINHNRPRIGLNKSTRQCDTYSYFDNDSAFELVGSSAVSIIKPSAAASPTKQFLVKNCKLIPGKLKEEKQGTRKRLIRSLDGSEWIDISVFTEPKKIDFLGTLE
jgi:hypothetical protein